ncbi:Protein Skeletor, isoforms B/C, partial [Orchesella cincta]
LLISALLLQCAFAEEQTSTIPQHFGLLIGKLNVYHHGVSGSVYAVNRTTILIKDFNYDGMGKDAFFWGGSTGTGPSPNGFIIPDQHGRTNVLSKADNKDFALTLPDNKQISEIKWIAVYDLSKYENYGDVYVPDGFEPPSTQTLPPLISKSDDCSSDQIELIDTKTIKIYNLNVHAADDMELYFVVGKGHVPSLRAGASTIIPDENGYFEPLRSYTNEDVELVLPGTFTFTDNSVHWLSVYDKKADKALGYYVTIPNHDESQSVVPPSLRKSMYVHPQKYDYTLPNCAALHRDFHVSWDVVGQTVTFELVALANDDDWLGFGVSGDNSTAKMIGGDVAIGHLNLRTGQGVVSDYNLDARAPCSQILDHKRGVCKDQELGKSDGIQVLEGRRVNNALTVIKYRRQLKSADELDKDFITDQVAILFLIYFNSPCFYNNEYVLANLCDLGPGENDEDERAWVPQAVPEAPQDHPAAGAASEDENDEGNPNIDSNSCVPFLLPDENRRVKPWGPIRLVDVHGRIGPSAGLRGYEGVSGYANPGYSWYIHGYVTPELYMQRGITYSFRVEGGNNPHNLETYHPFIITNEPLGGSAANLPSARILAGVEVTRRGQPRPNAAGRLCIWKHEHTDRRTDEKYTTFEKFRNTLKLRCEQGSQAANLDVTPNSSWPDVVYYHSYTQSNMGWKIHIVDSFREVASSVGVLTTSICLPILLLSIVICKHIL